MKSLYYEANNNIGETFM